MRFSESQATAFVAEWEVIDHVPDTSSGFSATIFRNRQTGVYTVAVRGSTDLTDFAADAMLIARDGLAVEQLVDLYNFWQRANTAAGQSYTAARLTLSVEPFPNVFQIAGVSYRIDWVNSSQLTDPALRQGTGALSVCPASLNVTGHSLGGHLSMAFTRLFPTLATDSLAINGLGFKTGSSAVNNLFAALGGGTSFPSPQIQNLYGIAGLEFAAMNNAVLQQPGSFNGVYIESASPLPPNYGGHGASQMTDSLALYSLYAKLAPSLSLASITMLLNGASATADRSLENALDALRTVLLGVSALTTTKTITNDRNDLYVNLAALQSSAEYRALQGSAAVRLTATQDAATLAANAKTDFGHFLAVKYLLPVAIEGAASPVISVHADLYAQWQADRVLTPQQRASGQANFTDEYLTDRAAFLAWKNKLALEDADASTTAYSKGGATDQWFRDNASNLTINLGSGAAPAEKRRFIFGADQSSGTETLSGGSQADNLYGGGGDDVLYGFDGHDHLEGGAGIDELYGGDGDDTLIGGEGDDRLYGGIGFDTYIVGQGTDTIIDEDGKGVVKDGQGREIAGTFIRGADGRYTWANAAAVGATRNSPLTITLENGARVVLENFDDFAGGELGIRLQDRPLSQATNGFRLGDHPNYSYQEWTGTPALVQGNRYEMGTRDALGRIEYGTTYTFPPAEWINPRIVEITREIIEENAGMVVYRMTNVVMSYTTFEATLTPTYTDDVVPRDDVFRFGASTENWRIETGQMSDFVVGGLGNDTVAGGADPDVVLGGSGDDTVFGGDQVDVAAYLEASRTVAGTGLRGDWLGGGRGRDTVVGTNDNDVLLGGGGEDLLVGGAGDDVLDGDDNYISNNSGYTNIIGLDIPENYLAFRTYDWSVTVGPGNNRPDPFNTVLSRAEVVEAAAAVGAADVIFGGTGNDRIHGLQGNDQLYGEAGNDVITGDDGADVIFGGDGNDLLTGERNGRIGSSSNPLVNPGDDYIDGGAGNDFIQGEDGNDYLVGGAGNDEIWGDTSYGTAIIGDDYLYGDDGEDRLIGGGGKDELFGGAGNDQLFGDTDDSAAADMGDDRLDGGQGDDYLRGHGGNDQLYGGEGNDTLIGDQGNDFLAGGDGIDRLEGGEGNDSLEAGNENDVLLGGDGNDTLNGGAGADVLSGGAGNDVYVVDGNDTIVDDSGVNVLVFANASVQDLMLSQTTGGNGETSFILSNAETGDQISIQSGNLGRFSDFELADGATYSYEAFMESVDAGDLILRGEESGVLLVGGRGNDTILGGYGDDTLKGGAGDDQLEGGYGNDVMVGGPGNDVLNGGYGADQYQIDLDEGELDAIDDSGENTIEYQNWYFDSQGIPEQYRDPFWDEWRGRYVYNGGEGGLTAFDSLEQAAEQIPVIFPWMEGVSIGELVANGELFYVPVVPEVPHIAGNDYVQLEQLWRAGAIQADTVPFGPTVSLADITVGGVLRDGNLFLRIVASSGGALEIRLARNDEAVGKGIERFVFADGTELSMAQMIALAPSLPGSNSAPVVNSPIVDTTAIEGQEFSFSLAADAFADPDDTLTYTATLSDGSALPDWLAFDSATLAFSGTPGSSSAGTLSIIVTATDAAGESASDEFTLDIANHLAGTAGNDRLTGTAGRDVIEGFEGNDVINGAAGADTLIGGLGNDTYYVDDAGDAVTELTDEGTDRVISTVSYTLGNNIENLTLSGTEAIDGTGNALANVIAGNAASNTLDGLAGDDRLTGGVSDDVLLGGEGNDVMNGSAGADAMAGGVGNDTYYVDDVGDAVTELADEGTDRVIASVNYVLGDNIENLTLTGTDAIDGTGNALNNVIAGNAASNTLDGQAGDDRLTGGASDDVLLGGEGNDVLNGSAGADAMTGGVGNDTYYVDDAGDIVTEAAGEGTDRVVATVTWLLADNVENLTLSGTDAINGAGNALDNVLAGNAGINYLGGGAGNDVLNGGAGLDFLEGGEGNDRLADADGGFYSGGAGNDTIAASGAGDFLIGGTGNDSINTGAGADVIAFNRGDGQDTLAASAGTDNTLSLGGGIAYSDLSFRRSGNSLILDIGVSDRITLVNWYANAANRSVLSLQMVAEAMADFDAGGADPLRDNRMERFDFAGLANAFDAARAADKSITSWALSNALLDFHLGGSDTEALGGDLAWQYGRYGNLANVGLTGAQNVLGNAQFGAQAQALQPLAGLQEGSVRLG